MARSRAILIGYVAVCKKGGSSMLHVSTFLRRLATLSFAVSTTATALIFLITLTELLSRTFARSAIAGASDYTSYLLCVVVFFGLPMITREGGQIAVSILIDRFTDQNRKRINFLVEFVSGVACLVVTAITLDIAVRQFSAGTMTVAAAQLPKWVISAFLAYGFGLSGLLHLTRAADGDTTSDVAGV